MIQYTIAYHAVADTRIIESCDNIRDLGSPTEMAER